MKLKMSNSSWHLYVFSPSHCGAIQLRTEESSYIFTTFQKVKVSDSDEYN
jgi:hypothetical protein